MTLVERLRSFSNWMISCACGNIPDEAAMCLEAADLISTLEAELEKAREALEPFAKVAENDIGEDETDQEIFRSMDRHNRAPRLTVGDLRRAREVFRSLIHKEG